MFQGGYSSYEADSVLLDSLVQLIEREVKSNQTNSNVDQPILDTAFYFNPNKITFDHMILLGFDSVIAKRIVKYRNNGGRFNVKKDLLRIYDLPETKYAKLEKYIRLPDTLDKSGHHTISSHVSDSISRQENKILTIDINKADTSELMTIHGIGSILSKRIIKYRDLLGGYSNIDQLNDVYGLKGISLTNIKSIVFIDTLFTPEKIRVNFCDWKELVNHPYIDSRLANDIINLRSTKGFLYDVKDLYDIHYLNDSILNRLSPYFEF